jgi:hypothetical protein
MANIPNSCISCPYENSCNTAIAFSDCHFYSMRKEKISLMSHLRNLFGKLFN